MTDYEKRIANPGIYLDPVERLKQRERVLFDFAERQKQRERICSDPNERAKERERLMTNPGTEDIFNVLGKRTTI